jgi:AcrR family transcriptional regulator
VLENVLEAAMSELGRVGYAALRIDDVAARSGVNKTTIYRRWPTKSALMTAVLEHATEPPTDFDTGSLLGDMRATLRDLRARIISKHHRGVVQVLLGERAHPEVAALVQSMRERHDEVRRAMFERGIARGELPQHAQPALLTELMCAPLIRRIVHLNTEADDAFLDVLATVICEGARALPAP